MNNQQLMATAQKALSWVEQRREDLEPGELAFLNGIAKGYNSFMTPAGETQLDNIERRYGINGKGLSFIHPGSTGGKGSVERKGVKVHHGAHGEVFEFSSEAKMAPTINAGQKDAPVSLDRWLAAALLGERCHDKAAVDYAHETKSMSTGTGGVLLPVGYQADWTDRIRAQMVLNAAGMTTVTMNNPTVTSSRILTDPVAGWRAEGGALNASDPTFELKNLVAKSIYVRTKATAELVADSPDWGAQLMAVMSKTLAVEIDRAGLFGTGAANQPRGLANTVGINTQPKGTDPVHDALIKGFSKCMAANCAVEDVDGNAIMSPDDWVNFVTLRTSDGQYIDGTIAALKRTQYRPTTAVPQGSLFVGDFRELVLGVRQEAQVEVLKLQSYGDNLMLEFVGTARVDFLCRRPASFTEVTGL